MSSPEASIEEILASIRKTFTDEPGAAGAATPSPAPAGIPSFRSAIETPAADLAKAPLPTPPRSRAALIDDELDDLIEKPSPRIAAAEKPVDPPPSVSSVEAAREKWANLLNPHAASNGASAKAGEPKLEAAATQPSPTPATPSAAPTGLFAPRKGGFYPPQPAARAEPDLPMPSPAPSPAARPSDSLTASAAAAAAQTAPALNGSSFGAAPAPMAPISVPEPPAPRPGFIPFAPVSAPAPVEAKPEPAPAPVAEAPPVAEVPPASARALDDLVAGLNGVAQKPAEPAPASPPFEPVVATAPAVAAAPAPTIPAPAATAAVAATPAPAPAAVEVAAPSSASRSFEDVVADMLRPLLEKWIDENMPRIVERALQRDAALGRKPGP